MTTLECNVDINPTQLYMMVQQREWAKAMRRADEWPDEARTYVRRIEQGSGKLRWRMLPLHAAIIMSAPTPVIEALLDNHKDASKCDDDNGMLPIHLAVKKHANDDVINLLLAANPSSIDMPNGFGLTPYEMAELSSSPYKEYYLRALRKGPTYNAVTASMSELLCGVELPDFTSRPPCLTTQPSEIDVF